MWLCIGHIIIAYYYYYSVFKACNLTNMLDFFFCALIFRPTAGIAKTIVGRWQNQGTQGAVNWRSGKTGRSFAPDRRRKNSAGESKRLSVVCPDYEQVFSRHSRIHRCALCRIQWVRHHHLHEWVLSMIININLITYNHVRYDCCTETQGRAISKVDRLLLRFR